MIGIAGEMQAGEALDMHFQARDPEQVSHFILRHGSSPFEDSRQQRLGRDVQDISQLSADELHGFFLGQIHGGTVSCSAQEDAKQCRAFGCAALKLVMHKSAGHHALAFAARH